MYTLTYHQKIPEDISSITKTDKKRIQTAIEKKLTTKPLLFGEPLRSTLTGNRKLRVGDYRVVYRAEKKHVLILMIAHKRLIYKEVTKRA